MSWMDRLETVDASVRRLVCRYKEINMLHLADMFVDRVCFKKSTWRCEKKPRVNKRRKKKQQEIEKKVQKDSC